MRISTSARLIFVGWAAALILLGLYILVKTHMDRQDLLVFLRWLIGASVTACAIGLLGLLWTCIFNRDTYR